MEQGIQAEPSPVENSPVEISRGPNTDGGRTDKGNDTFIAVDSGRVLRDLRRVSAPTAPVQEGEILAEKYRVERVLGVGGMGVVVAATHLQLDQLVALKFMLPSALSNQDHVARFLREARAAVKLRNEHVARVLDLGTLASGAPVIVFEYLEGCDLAAHLTRRGPLPVHEAIEYLLQVLEAIAEAHANGIIHRDLKPTNLFLVQRPDGSPSVKVLDFGISKVSGADDLALTKTTAIMGSPSYMSPEQMRSSRDVDGRTDIWALGAILYQFLSGQVPFKGETITELCVQVLQDQPTPLSLLCQGIPKGLEEIVLHCLEKSTRPPRPKRRRVRRTQLIQSTAAIEGESHGEGGRTMGPCDRMRVGAVPFPRAVRAGRERHR